jgi:hypothetical protein
MDPQDIDSLKKLDEGEWRIYIANKIEKSIVSSASLSSVHERINALPCVQHTEQIQTLTTWKADCTDESKEKFRGGISLKNAIIAGIIIAVISNIPNFIILLGHLK